MLRPAICSGIAIGLLSAALGVAPAQVKESALKGQKAESGSALRAKSILGATVHLEGNARAGTIEDIVFDQDGVIDYFIVSDGGKLVTVPWEAAKFNFEKRTAVINITETQYRQIPTYTVERYPEFYTPTYRTQIYKYYNLTPNHEHRFNHRFPKK